MIYLIEYKKMELFDTKKNLNYAMGNIVVDFIGKYENLQEDFNTICRKIGIQKPLKLKKSVKTRHKHYTKYYPTQELKDLVEFIYKKDVDYFGYKYGE